MGTTIGPRENACGPASRALLHSIGVLQFCGEVQRELALPVASGELLAIWLVESEEISEGVVAATALLALEDQQLASIVDTP